MTFFVPPLKYANFHREYYPTCVIPLDLLHFCQHNTLFYHLKINPLLLLKLAKKLFFFGEYFCLTYFSYVEK